MNAGATMLRIYEVLKDQVMNGAFAPGERLDPARLALDLAVSPTPVRDVLHRLTGERLIENPIHDGFRQLPVSEPMLRDLYEWSHQFSLIVTTAASRSGVLSEVGSPPGDTDVPSLIRLAFGELANASPNREHRMVMAGLNDRLAIFRRAEDRVLDGALQEIRILGDAVRRRAWHEVRVLLNHFHRRRLRAVGRIASEMRPS